MDEKKLYQQKKQAELDEWQAEVNRLKAELSGAGTDAQLALKKQIETLEGKIEQAKDQLGDVAQAGEDTWESIKERVESAWDSMKTAFSGVAAKLKK